MEFQNVIYGNDIRKKYKGFELAVDDLQIPKGFATALIGENGAGKTTLLSILAGIRLDFKGTIEYFDEKISDIEQVRERIGYTAPGNFFLPGLNVEQVGKMGDILFESFDLEKYHSLQKELNVPAGKKIMKLSDGNKMKVALMTAFARKTECLILDEPASPLDPLMRDKLCEMIRYYLEEGNGEQSVFFSTHNISDMENVTDYAIIMERGCIVEQGFVEDLKSKYILVKGEAKDIDAIKPHLYTYSSSVHGFEGICLAENMDKLAGYDISKEVPTLYQISVAVMKSYTKLG